VRKLFSEALAKQNMKPRMEEAYQAELADLPPPRHSNPVTRSGEAS
jgi:hypothetical protein